MINLREDINESYIPFFQNTKRIAILYGGAGAGKSYASTQKLIIQCLLYEGKKILVLRKTYPALKLTCFESFLNLLQRYNIPHEVNKSDLIITTRGNKIIFKSLDDPEKIKSITDVDYIWIEEPTEITERDFDMVNLRLRGQELPEGHYRQIILTFNPVDKSSWLYKRFFEREAENTWKKKYTYKDNKFIDKEYIEVLESYKYQDKYLYQVYCQGEWGVFKGRVYDNYVIENFHDIEYDEIIAGIDFGYNNPTAYLLIGLKDDEIYVFDEIYKTHLTTPEIISLIREKNKEHEVDPVIYSETEPDRIKEFEREGFRIYPAKKDVLLGINFLKRKKIHIHERCINTIKEIQAYKYKEDKYGNVLEEPVKAFDHAMDAMRYAVYTHYSMNWGRVEIW